MKPGEHLRVTSMAADAHRAHPPCACRAGGWARCAPPSSVAATVEHRPADMLWHRRACALLERRGARRELHRAVRLLRSSGFVLAACDAFAAIIEKGR